MEITPEIQAEIDRLVAEKLTSAVASELKPLKDKLDQAYIERDTALRKVADADKEVLALQKKHDLALLNARDDGRKANDSVITDLQARLKSMEDRNLELSKAEALNDALGGYSFRSATAAKMAREMIAKDLQQNAEGVWVHKDGRSVAELAKTTLDQEENSFMLKPPVSSGGGAKSHQRNAPPKAIGEMSNTELIEHYTNRGQ